MKRTNGVASGDSVSTRGVFYHGMNARRLRKPASGGDRPTRTRRSNGDSTLGPDWFSDRPLRRDVSRRVGRPNRVRADAGRPKRGGEATSVVCSGQIGWRTAASCRRRRTGRSRPVDHYTHIRVRRFGGIRRICTRDSPDCGALRPDLDHAGRAALSSRGVVENRRSSRRRLTVSKNWRRRRGRGWWGPVHRRANVGTVRESTRATRPVMIRQVHDPTLVRWRERSGRGRGSRPATGRDPGEYPKSTWFEVPRDEVSWQTRTIT